MFGLRILAFFLVFASSLFAEERPNILFCIADDWGWPHAGAYGDEGVLTPAFDRVAEQGVLMRYAFVSSPSCTPSRNAILTGRYHWELGPGAQLWSTLPEELETFPHLLEDAGYRIGHYRKSWGPGKLDGKWEKRHPAGPKYQSFEQFLAEGPENQPFAFWLGARDPHRGYREGSGVENGIDLEKVHLFEHFPDHEVVRSDVADYYHEVQRFDRLVGHALDLLDERGVLDNTLVVVTGDHGMPFPRAKSNCYDSGVRVPLAILWKAGAIHRLEPYESFVSLVDLAPTFLEAAGLEPLEVMNGRSLLPVLRGEKDDFNRSYVIFGKERHVPGQEAPDMGGYPTRGIRTERFLYLRNYQPDRWPNGGPNWKRSAIPGVWYGDTDNGPTKTYIIEHKDSDEAHARYWQWNFGKRPAEELYDCELDPGQLTNVIDDPAYKNALLYLKGLMQERQLASGDPRAEGGPPLPDWDNMIYLGRGPRHPDAN